MTIKNLDFVNGFVACAPPPPKSKPAPGKLAVATAADRELVPLTVLATSLGAVNLYKGDLVYVRGASLAQLWASETFVFTSIIETDPPATMNTPLVLVPVAQVVAYKRV